MQLTEKTKKVLWIVLAVALLVVIVAWMILDPGPEHIEDTNGADNYALQQITKRDVLENKMGTRGGPSVSETKWSLDGFNVSSGVKYSSRKFTGVYLLHACTIFKGSDIYVSLSDFYVRSGNFAFYVVFDGEIVGEVKPNELGISDFLLENIKKTATLQYIIAGESANFRFTAPADW